MTRPHHSIKEKTPGPHYDVYLSVPKGTQLDLIREKAIQEVRIPADKVESMIQALALNPRLKIRSEVSRAQADKASLYFTKAGLAVSLVPVLTLEEISQADRTQTCTACGKRVELNAKSECPRCGAVVGLVSGGSGKIADARPKDSIDDQIPDRDALEAALRKQIRAELEKELGRRGRRGVMRRPTQIVMVCAVLVLAGLSFGAGRWRAEQAGKEALLTLRKAYTGLDFDQMLAKLEAPSGKPGDSGNVGARAIGPKDSLFSIASQGAVSGETAAETREVVGWLVVGGLSYKKGLVDADSRTTSSAGPGAGGGVGADGATLPAQQKLALGLEFARALAEMGQLERASEAVKAVGASTAAAGDAGSAVLVKQVELEVRARAAGESAESRRRQLLESLRTDLLAMPDLAARSLALSRVAALLAESPNLPSEVPIAFFALARSGVAALTDPGQRNHATGALQVATGRALMAESVVSAKAGAWGRVSVLTEDIGALVEQAANSDAAIQLLALELRGRALSGLGNDATPRLVKALELVEKEASVISRADMLRSLAEVPGMIRHDRFQAALERLETAAENQSGLAKARTLITLSLIYADAGDPGKVAAYRKRAQETQGLSKPESILMHAELVASGDIAAARKLHAANAYGEAESRIRRLAGYLL